MVFSAWSESTLSVTHLKLYQTVPYFNLFPNKPLFLHVCGTGLFIENTVAKGEIARNEQFLRFPQCYLTFWRTLCYFHQIQNCHLQTLSVLKNLKFVVWEGVKNIE